MSLARALAAVAALLGCVVIYQAVAPIAALDDPPPAAMPQRHARHAPERYVPPDADRYAIINQRPVFDPARRALADPAEQSAASTPPPAVTLIGIAIGPWSSVALLRKSDGTTRIARLGDDVDGWQLVRIARDQVIFHAGGTDYPVAMQTASGGAPATAPVAAAVVAPAVAAALPPPPKPRVHGGPPPPGPIMGKPLPRPGQFVDSDGRPLTAHPGAVVDGNGKPVQPGAPQLLGPGDAPPERKP